MYGNIIERYNLVKKIIIYLRKSREEQINGYGSVEFTLERHEEILQTWALNNLGYKIPEECIFREVGGCSDRVVHTVNLGGIRMRGRPSCE